MALKALAPTAALLILNLVLPTLAATGYNAGSKVPCPSSPTTLCSFYFTGSRTTIPSFNIPSYPADVGFSAPIVWGPKPLLVVTVSNSGPAVFFGSVPAGTTANGYNSRINDFFYLSSSSSPSKLAHRSFNQVTQSDVAGRCVLLQINSAQVKVGGQTVTNLNPNDGNSAFPQDKRCIVFKTV